MSPVLGKVPLVSNLDPTRSESSGLINGLWLTLSSDCSLGETSSILLSQTERDCVLKVEADLPEDLQECHAQQEVLGRHSTENTRALE